MYAEIDEVFQTFLVQVDAPHTREIKASEQVDLSSSQCKRLGWLYFFEWLLFLDVLLIADQSESWLDKD